MRRSISYIGYSQDFTERIKPSAIGCSESYIIDLLMGPLRMIDEDNYASIVMLPWQLGQASHSEVACTL